MEIKRYTVTSEIDYADGNQYWETIATSIEEAKNKIASGDADIYDEDIEVCSLTFDWTTLRQDDKPITICNKLDIPPHLLPIVQLAAVLLKQVEVSNRMPCDLDDLEDLQKESFAIYKALTPEHHAILDSVRKH